MNKIFLLAVFAVSMTAVAQKLPADLTTALKSDDTRAMASLVTADNMNTCYQFKSGNLNVLQLAASMNSSNLVNHLITVLKINVNAACTGKPALHLAASNGNSVIVQQLLKAGADDSVSFEGKTAKEFARESRNESTIALFK